LDHPRSAGALGVNHQNDMAPLDGLRDPRDDQGWTGLGRAVLGFDSPAVTGWDGILALITDSGWELVSVVPELQGSSYFAAPPVVLRYRLFCKQPA